MTISSSIIRLPHTDSREPARTWTVEGRVIHGDERGRTLGFPTANLALDQLGLADGVWAGVATWTDSDGVLESHPAAISIGRRPTYYGGAGIRLLEAFLLDFTGNLYERHLIVSLRQRIRPQRRFANSEELVQQLRDDVAATRAWAGNSYQPGDVRRGRFGPTSRKNPSPASYAHVQERRRMNRENRVRDAVAVLAPDEVTHDRIAELSGIPLNYLMWAYSDCQALLAVGSDSEAPS
ncbi:riboflavin kinase [Cryobacterium aureum]|uniref:riboflavin kinase n=1 Tax=Cryobacterium aureum TaxID=995037 RepID=UPI000CF47BDC|nr:riboflavin kinase [Cryobacterium aureum]